MEFANALPSRIIGQEEEGVQALVDLYQVLCVGLNSPERPLGSLLFLGPTGTGKTRHPGMPGTLIGIVRNPHQAARMKLLFHVRTSGKEFLIEEGTDPRYGARHLKRAIERHLVCPWANLLASGQLLPGDMLCVDWTTGLETWLCGKRVLCPS